MLKYYKWSFIIMFLGLGLAFWRGVAADEGGLQMMFFAAIIMVLEVSLSFDNAVINATKLEKMSPIWRHRFLTWGIAIAVFGMRFVFPIAIVAIFSGISSMEVIKLALHNPDEYARHLHEAHIGIASFGGAFLIMLFFEFMFDEKKTLHWIALPEKILAKAARFKWAPTALAVIGIAAVQPVLTPHDRMESIIAGAAGIIIHLLIHGISAKLECMAAKESAFALKHAGLAAFIYLELIDASFSLDGVLGAFALTKDVVIITIGLAVGAFFVRSMTIMLVEKKTLEKLRYLQHGAYWAIGALAVIMIASTIVPIPEIFTGLIGMVLIVLALISSIRHNKKLEALQKP